MCAVTKIANARNKRSTALLHNRVISIISLERFFFFKFYRRHHELVSKFNVGLKPLLHQGLSEPVFYGDLVYKFKKLMGRTDVSDQFETTLYITNVFNLAMI